MYNIHTQIHISIYYIDIHIYTNNVLPDGFRHDSGGEIRGRDACMTQRRGEEEGFAHLIAVSRGHIYQTESQGGGKTGGLIHYNFIAKQMVPNQFT